MAKLLRDNRINVVKCYRCRSIYVSYKWEDGQVEPCPACGAKLNDASNVIPIWIVAILRIFGRV